MRTVERRPRVIAGSPRAEQFGKFSQGCRDVDQSQACDRAARVVAGQDRRECRTLEEIVSLPESRPRNQDEQEPGFKQQGNEKKPPEQNLASGLHS